MEARNVNPFIVGDWIKTDKDFIGRKVLIDQILALQRRCYWLIGSRRIGKTSLLRYLQRRLRENLELLPVFWDVSGARTTRDLVMTFLDSLDASHDDLSQRNLDLNVDQVAEQDIYFVLRALLRTCRHHKIKLVLLIDEAEGLFKLFARELELQQKLKAVLDSENIHMIMASNHGLEGYDPLSTEHLLSPFLQSFMPVSFLTAWSDEEARLLVARCSPDACEQDHIIKVTGALPFLVQMVCFYRFELGSLAAAVEKIHHENMLDLFFRHDMQCLGMVNSRMLAYLGRQEHFALKDLQALHASEPSWPKRMQVLLQLGFITSDTNHHYRISNEFLQRWLLASFEMEPELIRSTMNEQARQWLFIERDHTGLRIEWNGRKVVIGDLMAVASANRQAEDARATGIELYGQLFGHPSQQELRDRLSSAHEFFEIYIRDLAGTETPYEWLHDKVGFLSLRHAILRAGSGLIPRPQPALAGPLRVLLVAADTPPHIPWVDEELLLIREQLQSLAQEMKRDTRVTCLFSHQSDLQTVMHLTAAEPFHVIHFAGHAKRTRGTVDHLLYFNRLPDKQQGVKGVLLSEWLNCVRADVHLFYLNGCGIGTGIDLTGQEPGRSSFIITNQAAVADEMAARFAVDFYRHLFSQEMNPMEALQRTRRQWAHASKGVKFSNDYWLFPIIWRQK